MGIQSRKKYTATAGLDLATARMICGASITGPNNSRITVYSGDAIVDGNQIVDLSSIANDSASITGIRVPTDPLKGVHVVVTGASATAILYYEEG